MPTESEMLEQILAQAQQLSPENRLRLIRRVVETMLPGEQRVQPRPLVYGQFQGQRLSSDEDFLIAKWRPTEQDLNGA